MTFLFLIKMSLKYRLGECFYLQIYLLGIKGTLEGKKNESMSKRHRSQREGCDELNGSKLEQFE